VLNSPLRLNGLPAADAAAHRTFFAEAVIWESFSSLSTVPTSPEAQQAFGLLVSLLSVRSSARFRAIRQIKTLTLACVVCRT
jgi:hypothetical protein